MKKKMTLAAAVATMVFGLGVYSCTEQDTADKVEESMEKQAENVEETMDKFDGEGPLVEAAEDIEQFGENAKEEIAEGAENMKQGWNESELEQKIDEIIADAKNNLEEAGQATVDGAEAAGNSVKEITVETKRRIDALVDSVSS